MVRSTATATHVNPVSGSKPTNKKISCAYWDCHRVDKDGLVIESWTMNDNMAMMQQMGLLYMSK